MKTILGTGQLGMALVQSILDKNPDEEILLVNSSGKRVMPLPGNIQLEAGDAISNSYMETIAKRSAMIFSCTDMPHRYWAEF